MTRHINTGAPRGTSRSEDTQTSHGAFTSQPADHPNPSDITRAFEDLVCAAHTRGRDAKLVSALLRAMGEFVASGRDPVVLNGSQSAAVPPSKLTTPGASTTAGNDRTMSISPALKELLTAVIDSLSDDETARYLSIGVRQVRRRAADGRLYFFTIGRRRRYPCWQFGKDHFVVPGLHDVANEIPDSWPPQRVDQFMRNAHPQLEIGGTLLSPVQWLWNVGSPDHVETILRELQRSQPNSETGD